MFSALFIRKLVLIAVIVATTLILGCSKTDQIEGSVKDIFGSPLSDVSVSIEKSAFKTKTDSSGAFGIDYAPGQFVVRFAKEGFTSHLLELNLHQKTHYPTGEVILYPIPSQEGMFFVDHQKKELVALPFNSLVHNRYTGLEKGTTRFGIVQLYDKLIPDFPAGAQQFIDTDPTKTALNKVRADDFAISEAKYWFGNETILYLDQPPETITREGTEKIILRTVELNSGLYSWVPYGRNNMGNSIPLLEKPAYTFSVSEGDKQEIAKASTPKISNERPTISAPVVKQAPAPTIRPKQENIKADEIPRSRSREINCTNQTTVSEWELGRMNRADMNVCFVTETLNVPYSKSGYDPDDFSWELWLNRATQINDDGKYLSISVDKENFVIKITTKPEEMKKDRVGYVLVKLFRVKNKRPVIESTPTPPRPAITEKEVIPQTPVMLDTPSTTTLYRPASKPAVPEEFIAKQKAIERQKPKVSSGDSFITMPCDIPSKFDNFELQSGQTIRVKVCFESEALRMIFVETPENDIQVKLVNVQGQTSIKGLQPKDFIRVHQFNWFDSLSLQPNNRAMKKSGVGFVVVDVTLR